MPVQPYATPASSVPIGDAPLSVAASQDDQPLAQAGSEKQDLFLQTTRRMAELSFENKVPKEEVLQLQMMWESRELIHQQTLEALQNENELLKNKIECSLVDLILATKKVHRMQMVSIDAELKAKEMQQLQQFEEENHSVRSKNALSYRFAIQSNPFRSEILKKRNILEAQLRAERDQQIEALKEVQRGELAVLCPQLEGKDDQ